MDSDEFEIEEDVASGSEKTGMDRFIEIFNFSNRINLNRHNYLQLTESIDSPLLNDILINQFL